MRVHLIRKETIHNFMTENAIGRGSFNGWLTKIKFADWDIPADIKATFPTADLLGKGSNRAIFNIGGNKYRLIAKYAFGENQVHLFICWIGTHAAYDKLCNSEAQYTISNY